MPKRALVNPPGTEGIYRNWHFSQAVRAGDVVWVSGQVGVDRNAQPADGIEAQSRLAFENLARVLDSAGATLADVVELTTFHVDLPGELGAFARVKDEFFPKDYPAWTAIGCTALALPPLRVEVRAMAVVGPRKSKPPRAARVALVRPKKRAAGRPKKGVRPRV
jgi:enamine deaminase RidA (YjgF/YER057c/UK114 family)